MVRDDDRRRNHGSNEFYKEKSLSMEIFFQFLYLLRHLWRGVYCFKWGRKPDSWTEMLECNCCWWCNYWIILIFASNAEAIDVQGSALYMVPFDLGVTKHLQTALRMHAERLWLWACRTVLCGSSLKKANVECVCFGQNQFTLAQLESPT